MTTSTTKKEDLKQLLTIVEQARADRLRHALELLKAYQTCDSVNAVERVVRVSRQFEKNT